MLIPLQDLVKKYNLDIKGVIEVGAHWAEEHDTFMQLGIKNIVYIEPCSDAFHKLLDKFGGYETVHNGTKVTLFNNACGEEYAIAKMKVSNNNQGQSNSLLNPKLHLQQHPEVVFTHIEVVTVNSLDNFLIERENYNFLYMDVQGAEGMVLKGATGTLKHIDYIYTECNRGQTYEGNMEIEEMDAMLYGYGFERVETFWASANWTWGDCFYIKK